MRSNSRFRTAALAATALLAALSLTACSDTDGDAGKAGAAAPAGNTASSEAGKNTEGAGTTDEDQARNTSSTSGNKGGDKGGDTSGAENSTGSDTGRKSSTGSTGNTGSTGSPVTCTGDNTKVTISKVSRPINHLLLTATNTGSRPCYAYNAPALRFDDAQAVFPVLRSSVPQAVVALEPGQSAYAGIGLFGETDGKDLYEGTDLTVYFTPRSNSGSTGSPAELKLPAGTHWGDNGFVTYWQSDMAVALTY
ncbi:DUF4232 domain-containing protein [Streptomyces sp. sk2.1]|uniref:DUF4232 domain-containing protein n=1 Tax=Streptomyces sp. sk2.1 TaxID=2478959 RepID=UPI0011E7EE40|nr:DUF4232 domain-containing protein [Streptomyces sp. sk2.1]TXS65445.1 DUF4232 domain-containing protein [Streptomyces sp. sk2.1]